MFLHTANSSAQLPEHLIKSLPYFSLDIAKVGKAGLYIEITRVYLYPRDSPPVVYFYTTYTASLLAPHCICSTVAACTGL